MGLLKQGLSVGPFGLSPCRGIVAQQLGAQTAAPPHTLGRLAEGHTLCKPSRQAGLTSCREKETFVSWLIYVLVVIVLIILILRLAGGI